MTLNRLFLLIPLLAYTACPAFGSELVRLPSVMPPSQPTVLLASNPETTVEPLPNVYRTLPPPEVSVQLVESPPSPNQTTVTLEDGQSTVTVKEEIWERPVDARNGFFQQLNFSAAWLPSGRGANDFGFTDLQLRGAFVLPFPTRRHPLMLRPGFTVHYLDGPQSDDLPPRLYDAYCQFRWLHKINPRWTADLSITPTVSSDFEQEQADALRWTGHGAAMFEWTDTFDLAMGVAYLDSDIINILPFVGFIWKPSDDLEIQAMMPRPSIARRIYWHGALGDEVQDWLYIAGELGSGKWAIKRPETGINDVISYIDYRLVLGLERRALFQLDYRVELAYVFGRKLESEVGFPDIEPNDTLMLRIATTY